MAPVDIVLGAIGLTAGLVVAWLSSVPLRLLEPAWLSLATTGLLFGFLGWVGAWVALVKKRDFAKALPTLDNRERASPECGTTKVLDTSAVIDGRFADLVRLGMLEGEIRVPRFVLSELHTLADSADDTRRARGRRGLDLLARLNQGADRGVEVLDADYPDTPDVDNKLVRLASDMGAVVLTVDHNLTSVARVRGIDALNLNEVASAMRPNHLPGERIRLRVIREGKEPGQGVGYLEDGTMVVVAGAKERVGTDADVEVTSVLQTSAGRMVFSRLLTEEGGADA
ncbi:MAG TPA: TRAM domain-containing protein, partial [Coriobacteriia bacterium]|nr:TRAM domain-containing protein [Coriobacteriia bacterium]